MKACYRKLHKYKYQLVEDFTYETGLTCGVNIGESIVTEHIRLSRNTGNLHIKKGYCWDGASGPTYDTDSSMRAGLVHDSLYQLIRMGKLSLSDRQVADELLYLICLEDGMWKWRAWLWYRAVKRFAGWAAEPGTQQNEIFCVGKE